MLTVLCITIKNGWPDSKSDTPECIHAYYDVLIAQGKLVFKGQCLVVPEQMCKEMMTTIHAAHIGIEGCIRRARETMYWPRMATEFKDYISKCDICLRHRSSSRREPFMQHEFANRPWSKVRADLCELNGRTLLVVCDYYSKVEKNTTVTTNSVSKVLKVMFSRYGVPNHLVTDNGLQFSLSESFNLSKEWGFDHVTSSPYHPQSNGKTRECRKDHQEAVC